METYGIKTGDIFITKDGKRRLIVGGNKSYGRFMYLTVDIDTCQIKSRICDTLESLLTGYEIVGLIKAEDVEINPCNVTEVSYNFVEEEESISEECLNMLFDRYDTVEIETDDDYEEEYDDEDDDDF